MFKIRQMFIGVKSVIYSKLSDIKLSMRVALKNTPINRKKVSKFQRQYLDTINFSDKSRLIIFLVPGFDIVNGGIMSILSLAKETRKLNHVHGADVFVCPTPGNPPLLKFTKFNNDETLVDIDDLLARCPAGSEVLIHVMAYRLNKFLKYKEKTLRNVKKIKINFNVLLQNIDLMPSMAYINQLSVIGHTTCTTAHRSYATKKTEQYLGCPVHHLSTFVSPEQYNRIPFGEKDNLIVVSPDNHPLKDDILKSINNKLGGYEIYIIEGISYEEYKRVIGRAKYSLTFGEGMDGYFIETVFSGGISFSVYNDKFFTPEYLELPGVYESWEKLKVELPEDIKKCHNSKIYRSMQNTQYIKLEKEYSFKRYLHNLNAYYSKYYHV